jgi:hypothetical protein
MSRRSWLRIYDEQNVSVEGNLLPNFGPKESYSMQVEYRTTAFSTGFVSPSRTCHSA